MQIISAILSLGLVGLIIYFAVSPKSSRLLKLSAFVALGLIALTLAICGIVLIRGPGESQESITLPSFLDTSPPPQKTSAVPVIVFSLAFLSILGLITYLALKEYRQKHTDSANKKDKKPLVLEKQEELDLGEMHSGEENFDMEFE